MRQRRGGGEWERRRWVGEAEVWRNIKGGEDGVLPTLFLLLPCGAEIYRFLSPHTPPPSVPGPDRKYFLLGGKGGVGKTSCSASLAVKFAAQGLPTLVVSTDPAHSLSDSVDQVWTYVWGA